MRFDCLIRCGRFIDGSGAEPREQTLLGVRGDRIVALDGAASDDVAEHQLDLTGYTVLPGLIDCHDHISYDLGDIGAQRAEGLVSLSLRAARNCAAALRAGITTLRDLGALGTLAMTCRDATTNGQLAGPRLQVAGTWITRTGGHVWMSGREADGPDELTRAVREQVRDGADWIKLAITGGNLTPRSVPTAPGFTTEEIRAAIAAAHFVGRPVTAHVHGGPGLRDAIEAGIDCIEHGTFATREELELMREHDVPLVSTYGVLEVGASNPNLDDEARGKLQRGQAAAIETIATARELGMTVALGTDLVHTELVREMSALLTAGYTPMEAIVAATSTAAKVLGLEDLGVLAPSKVADLIAVAGDPIDDINALRDVRLVMQSGQVVHDSTTARVVTASV